MNASISGDPVTTTALIRDVFLVDPVLSADFVFYIFCLIFAVCSLGVVTNVLNITVFIRQGLMDTVNISLLALTVSELCSLLPLIGVGVLADPRFLKTEYPIVGLEVQFLTASGPHAFFTRITGWITAYVMFERCVCVALPLRVRMIVTPQTTVTCLVVIVVLVLAGIVPMYATHSLQWKFYPEANSTLLGLTLTTNAIDITSVTNVLNNSVSAVCSFGVIFVCTCVIVVKLNRKSKWRTEVSLGKKKVDGNSFSSKDKRAIRVVTLISAIFLVSVAPSVVIVFVSSFYFEFSTLGKYRHLFYMTYSLTYALEAVSASSNFIIYYKLNGKFRAVFLQMFSATHSKL
ncbi:FMRFamide receptor-like [Physella acuta]|uniref:FMRFamide receptor-like n=1 Tax=Physella acuta TaxID=109671 RepID=UPI0027DD718D|nr:FMRFamide receptor-like [Physella acuta]